MKRPFAEDYERDSDYMCDLDEYADQLEEETHVLAEALHDAETDLDEQKEYTFGDSSTLVEIFDRVLSSLTDDENSPESEGGLTFSDGHGNEILLDDVCEDEELALEEEPISETRRAVMNYILDRINERFAELREMIDEDC